MGNKANKEKRPNKAVALITYIIALIAWKRAIMPASATSAYRTVKSAPKSKPPSIQPFKSRVKRFIPLGFTKIILIIIRRYTIYGK